MALESAKSEVKSWLEVALKHENLESFSLEFTGNTEKGQGYMGDVIFVLVNGLDKQGNSKNYNLVLKCSKSSKSLIDSNPVMRLSYLNEIYVYEKIFPTFKKFQVDLGVEEPFDNVPKCYGTFHNELKYVVVLEDLKPDYDTWDQKYPLTRKHIDLVVKTYGKFHAVSAAMKEKEPEKFQELSSGCKNVIGMFLELDDIMQMHKNNVEYVYQLIKDDDVVPEISQKWRSINEQLASVLRELDGNNDGLKVIVHGDCWNNNFMFKYVDDNIKAVMLDWQLTKLSSPLTDLAYFLFSCISEEDLDDLENILKTYYDSFMGHLKSMDSNHLIEYPFENLLKEWKKYFIYGVVLSLLVLKGGFIEKENIPDLSENADKGKSFSDNFVIQLSDKSGYVKRVLPLVKYTVNNFFN